MISLGIICYQGHSSSAALVKDGKTLGAVSEERFSRKKFDDAFPEKSIEYLTTELGISFEEIDHIAIGWSPRLTILGQLKSLHKKSLRFFLEKREGAKKRSRFNKFFLIANLKNEIKKRYQFKGEISFVDHHLAHAVSAYVQTEKRDGICMVADGMGEFASTSLFEFKGPDARKIYEDHFPHSLGVLYSSATQFLGFTPDSDEFKVMGLAAYSKSLRFNERFKELYRFNENHFELNLKYFEIHKKGNQFFSEAFYELFADVKTESDRMDFARSLQDHLNFIVLGILEKNKSLFHSDSFSASGGVFLNCLLNQKIAESSLFKSYTFFPVADDNGTALGAAQWVQMQAGMEMKKVDHLFLGPGIENIQISSFKNLQHKKISHVSEVAELLAKGKVIAWMQGRMEFGHRSLGNRSILGDPRDKKMKDIINEKVKFREPYRPFAPSFPEGKLQDFYQTDKTSYPFMIETLHAKDVTKELAPAIVHEDGTSRVQTVSSVHSPEFYELLKEFYKLTDCPILLNTSFNINGMPIVLSVDDAVDCFMKTEMDYLVIKDYLLWK
ncbi:hypothetical protein DOM21_16980 [Bacteriovorax stolpii]|uniref:Uncharacterized protein n=1 Tax=Bacteriovorax stolpii TaxID=960 RepID=A0A2K9NQA2_BACTC|nr:carbamoyltransferase C-terminal domain-containing protein [Bacteriovorax stolpii]AUN96954.1 hypothetical protein C0V70_02290 [Bacteriovorax stolpii]QDK43116.1 hypothetical protein DOM21_16980 [Bacteriovorax stolpii]TDP53234.1 carbamoyltransferase [Bacteriovorax stolpii]